MYGYGYKYTSGLVINSGGGGAPFANTSALDFDGVDDYVNVGNVVDKNKSTAFSISIWVNISLTVSNNILISKVGDGDNGGALSKGGVGYQLFMNNALYFRFLLDSHFSHKMEVRDGNYWGTSQGLNNGWHHIVGTYDGSGLSSGMTLYVDGYDVSFARVDTGAGDFNNTGDLYVGGQNYNGTPQFSFKGKLDEPCIIPTELTPAEVLDIYNGVRPSGGGVVGGNWQDGTGQPKSMTSYNSDLWLRNGDNGSYKSPQWLIPNNENFAANKVSNYSFQLDGVDDYIDVGTSLNLGTNSTISMWIKRGRVSTVEMLLGEDTYSFDLTSYIDTNNTLIFKVGTFSSAFNVFPIANTLNDTTNWIHICWVRSGDSVELFLNGVSMQTQTGFGVVTDTRFDTIGAKPNGSLPFNGNIDEVAAWNTNTINPLDIYNGGTPTTLPSGAVAHWKMGEDSTFLTNWTVPDAVGSNDGTSANMTIEDRIGEAPNSTNNALSFNMDFADVVLDTPPTP